MAYVGALAEALDLQLAVVDQLDAEHLRLPSQCEGWLIRDVIEHSVGVTTKFTDFAAGLTDEPHQPRSGLLGHDHRAALRAVSNASTAAWRSADMRRSCRLRFGIFPAEVAAGINLFDVLAHTWDIAASVPVALVATDELWVVGLAAARQVIGSDRDTAHYGPDLRVEATASPMTRFLGFLGRRHRP